MLDNTAECLRLRLGIYNQSDAKLLLPYPEITGLLFVNKGTLEESKWGTISLPEGPWSGLAIEPDETKQIDYCLEPVPLVPGDWEGDPPKWDGETFGDNILILDNHWWHVVTLPAGDYLVWYQWEAGPDYFDGFSHYRFRDIQREAEAEQAVAWTGEQKSNRLDVVRA